MIGNVVAFLQDAKRGRVSPSGFLRGIASLGATLPGTVGGLHPSAALLSPQGSQGSDNLHAAVQAFVEITAKICAGELPANIFLDTEFNYENSDTASEGIAPSGLLITGLESLVNIYLRVSGQNWLQPWSAVATAANFTFQNSSFTGPQEISRPDPNTLSPYNRVFTIGPEGDNLTERTAALHVAKQDPDSIGIVIERRHGLEEDCPKDDTPPGYQRALRNWNLLLTACLEDKDFASNLTTAQLNSTRILIEWWTGQTDNSSSRPEVFRAIKRASASGSLDQEAFRALRISKPGTASDTWEFYQQRIIQPSSGPAYVLLMFRLFQLEFLPYHYDKKASRLALRGTRILAARIAACQRVAISCYKTLLKDCSIESRQMAKEAEGSSSRTPGTSQMESSIHCSSSLPQMQAKIETEYTPSSREQSRQLAAEEQGILQAFVYGGPGFKIGASMSPCEWLEETGDDDDLPYYLWDVEQKCTVTSSKVIKDAQYTAISHTWGRWMLEDTPPVDVEGVEQWKIPQNSKFSVQNLPHILASVPTHTRYIWFDLVCIPQRPPEPDLVERARLEIGRQAKIFRRAQFAIAWINEDQVEGWNGLRAAIRRLSVHYLQEDSGMPISQPILDLALRDSDSPLELFDSTSDPTKKPEDLINGWFSSLWTLQELCLRPDMRLCTKTWEMLTVGADGQTVVGLDDLIVLAQGGRFSELQSEGGRGPGLESMESGQSTALRLPIEARSKATKDLWELLDLSGVDHLLDASRSTILALGNQRYCKEFRAQAIMSAIGVADWHGSLEARKSEGDVPAEEQDQYPLAFLEECAEKIGADLYASCLAEGELIEMLVLSLNDKNSSRNAVASLFPFTSSLMSRSPSLAEGYTGKDHPAIRTWKIQPDRSVEIREVAILSFSGQRRTGDRNLSCTLMGPDTTAPVPLLVQKQFGIDLDDWIDSFIPSTRNFAVCLHHDVGVVDGLLLKELSSGELIKVGTYLLTKRNAYRDPMPTSHRVNWRVL